MSTGPDLKEAQQPAYLRAGTHVILPARFYYELEQVLTALSKYQKEARLRLTNSKTSIGRQEIVEGLASIDLDPIKDSLRRHARNCGVY